MTRRYAPPPDCIDTREEQDAYYRAMDSGWGDMPTKAELDADELPSTPIDFGEPPF